MKYISFKEWVKMKKHPWKQTMPKKVISAEDQLSKDYKGHLKSLGTIEPWKLTK